MILPNVRASLRPGDMAWLVDLLASYQERSPGYVEDRLLEEGLDALLDDPRTLNALLTAGAPAPAVHLTFYVMVRHALLESGLDDRLLSDYLAAILVDFGRGDRAERAAGSRFHYLVDMVSAMASADGRVAFELQAHLGDYALWLSGVFPDHVTARVQRRGAPGLRYYEELGATGYRLAARSTDAASHGLDGVLRQCAELFPELRVALNRVSDRYLFPHAGGVERVLRQVADDAGR